MVRPAWIALVRIADIGAQGLAEARRRLGPADRRRYTAFRSAKRRREFLAGRWLLQASAGRTRLRFDSAPRGGLRASARSVSASLAHAGGWVACALLEGGRIGVDIEPMVDRDFAAAGEWVFGRAEGRHAFYERWTRYEARVKANAEKEEGFVDRTYRIGNVALSVCAPSGARLGRPRRWPPRRRA
jgi:hypothetical protein